ncbi:hypothetical protein ATCV1_z153L [Acanthocystis turfacea chlorella virus 1]|uniref:Uncharacterized protein z153L n=1 Tax=Chlorovirus heliozoae TaxID=322019 RepID=A7K8B3_9PHYC|nr:hypothetical protein ATCV1_z153L [Acanthocystis turfacea chlorella virus 1]ABT16287.1 hypothetical protein ATCV1_z153L [Acanthocystis turfacea chlorella virus 1]
MAHRMCILRETPRSRSSKQFTGGTPTSRWSPFSRRWTVPPTSVSSRHARFPATETSRDPFGSRSPSRTCSGTTSLRRRPFSSGMPHSRMRLTYSRFQTCTQTAVETTGSRTTQACTRTLLPRTAT